MGLLNNILGTIQTTFSIGKGTDEVGIRTNSGILQGRNNGGSWKNILVLTTNVNVDKTSSQNITANVLTKITFNNINRDLSNEYNTDNNRYICAYNQEILVCLGLDINNPTQTLNNIELSVYKNGNLYRTMTDMKGSYSSTNIALDKTTILSLQINDYIEFYIRTQYNVSLTQAYLSIFNFS